MIAGNSPIAVPSSRTSVGTTRRELIFTYESENCSFAPRSTGMRATQIPFSARKIRTRREFGEPLDSYNFKLFDDDTMIPR